MDCRVFELLMYIQTNTECQWLSMPWVSYSIFGVEL